MRYYLKDNHFIVTTDHQTHKLLDKIDNFFDLVINLTQSMGL
jgi:hypothetical protein